MSGEGNIVAGQTTAETQQTTTAATAPPLGQETAAVRPDWLPEPYWDAEKSAPKGEDLTKHLQEYDARAKDIPQDGNYKFELDPDFKLPEGVQYKLEPNDPTLKSFQENIIDRLKTDGQPLTQRQVSALFRFEAQRNLATYQHQQSLEAAAAAEMKALGDNSGARVDEARRWLNTNLPEASAKTIALTLSTKAGVEGVEALIGLTNGVKMRGLPTGTRPNPNDEIVDKIGTVPAMQIFAAAAQNMRN